MNTVLTIHIDRLVIDGIELSAVQQHQLKVHLEETLNILFTERGIPAGLASFSSTEKMPVNAIQLKEPQVQPAHLGKQVAHSLYQSLHNQG